LQRSLFRKPKPEVVGAAAVEVEAAEAAAASVVADRAA